MKDSTVGRINHKGHDHPDTPHARQRCRAEAVAAAAPQMAEVKVRKGRTKSTPAPTPTPLTLTLNDLRGLGQSLEAAQDALSGYAVLVGAAVRLTSDGVPILATYVGDDWQVKIG